VTETALTTALNVSYMAEQLSLFGLIVGIALLLSGIGFVVLALAALGGVFREKADATVTAVTPVASH
jgi:F0F1-type ATP synthase membrane subunit c/vacuolar-type H+-ATPase subunit K